MVIVIVLPTICYAILRSSAVQSYIASRIASYMSSELNAEVSVGGLNIDYYLDITIEDVVVKDQKKENLLNAPGIKIDIHKLSIRKRIIEIDKIILDNTKVSLKKYKGEENLNFQFILDYFSSEDTTITESEPWGISCSGIELLNSDFSYRDENSELMPNGLDFSNLNFSELNVLLSDFKIDTSSTSLIINKISFKEKQGFILNEISTELELSESKISLNKLKIKTPNSELNLNLDLTQDDFSAFNDFVNQVNINAEFVKSKFNTKDIGYFVTELYNLDNLFSLTGKVKGKVNNLKLKDFVLAYGKSTKFDGKATITGLPDIKETFIHLALNELSTSKKDFESFKMPNDTKDNIVIPPQLVNLGKIKIKGYFTGFYNDFVANADFYTDIGNATSDISLRKNKNKNIIEYDGKLAITNFNLGELVGQKDEIGNISLSADITGSGLDKSAIADFNINISSIDIKNYNYSDIKLKGNYNNQFADADVIIVDKNLNLNLSGTFNFKEKLPKFNINSEISNANLVKLNLFENDSLNPINPILSTKLSGAFSGNKLENINGNAGFSNTKYVDDKESYYMDSLYLSVLSNNVGEKQIKLKSDFADADVEGEFKYDELVYSFKKMIKEYLPGFDKKFGATDELQKVPVTKFTYKISLYNTSSITALFLPELAISENTELSGKYNGESNSLTINGNINSIKYKDNVFEDFFFDGRTTTDKVIFDIGCKRLYLSDSLWIDNVSFNTSLKNDTINYSLLWDNKKDTNQSAGDIEGLVSFLDMPTIKLKILPSKIIVKDSIWKFSQDNYISLDSTLIEVHNLVLGNQTQKLVIDGRLSKLASDKMIIKFTNFNLSNFDLLTEKRNVDFDGIMTGDFEVFDIYNSPNFFSNIKLLNFGVNHEQLGDLIVKTTWDNNAKSALIDAEILYTGEAGTKETLIVNGYVFPEKENNNLDLNIELKSFNLDLLENYLSSFSSEFYGRASGILNLKGSFNAPELTGNLKLWKTGIKIDYLNTTYILANNIILEKNAIIFDKVELIDNNVGEFKGKKAILDGKIYHENFRKWALDLSIKPDHFTMLNTNSTQNELFYGKAVASGLIKIHGDVDNIVMDIKAKTERGTVLFIPLDYTEEVSETDYISFTIKDSTQTINAANINETIDLSGISLNFEFEVTPDAEIQLILDETIGDIIKAKGSADLKMGINTRGEFEMFGEYVISEGDYLFTLQNVINKRFSIQQGGTIKWTGSPYDAEINLKAIYKTKASLYDLVANKVANAEIYKKKLPVECVLLMKDKLMNPSIEFDIVLPTADEISKDLLRSELYVSANEVNVQEMNRQFVGLLVLNSFFPPPGGERSVGSTNIGSTSSTELLSNQLSNWLSQISDDFDVGVNYKSGDKLTNEELQVALSTQLFNDRVIIDGNLGVGGDQNVQGDQSAGKTSNIVGDVNIEYKWTDEGRFRIKAFNKSNATDLLNQRAPYTQGIGVFYRKEFDKFGELFKWIKPKKEK
ncbi:MAG: translocation/assembly module TamB domain-containing protein [Saprospiraceae bacterium]|nr:translocation/assembly module TamB domain-containing protein [Saprospiraceae bacterium]